MSSILQPWVTELGLRHQGVLVTALRGCDGCDKENNLKILTRELRGLILVPFDERELSSTRGFMCKFPSESAEQAFLPFARNEFEALPLHFGMHFLHAVEVIRYKHPYRFVKDVYRFRYHHLCKRMHVTPETTEEMDARLTADRIKLGTVED